jgi:hypothetical protein
VAYVKRTCLPKDNNAQLSAPLHTCTAAAKQHGDGDGDGGGRGVPEYSVRKRIVLVLQVQHIRGRQSSPDTSVTLGALPFVSRSKRLMPPLLIVKTSDLPFGVRTILAVQAITTV